jgi:hypothetical protein
VEDRIYRSLRTAQERDLQGHATSAQPVAAAAESAPAHEPAHELPGHVIPAAHVGSKAADLWGARWFARGASADRPRISLIGTLSLSVLISAGLFAAQMIVKPRHGQHAGDDRVAADSHDRMHLIAGQSGEDTDGTVSLPSRFHHVQAPASHSPHARTHSAHSITVAEQSSPNDSVSEEAPETPTPAVRAHHSGSTTGSVQHAAEETDVTQPGNAGGQAPATEQSTESLDLSAPAAAPACNQNCAKHNSVNHATSAAQVPAPQIANAVPNYPASPHTSLAGAQPSAVTSPPAEVVTVSQWPVAAPTHPATSALQVSAEAPAAAPTLTIVPGRSEGISPGAAAPPIAPPAPVQLPPAEASAGHLTQSANVYTQDHAETAAPTQAGANPFEALDRTKVMSFQFRNAPWTLVLAKFANATGLELRMQALPDGTFNRWDSARYTPSQTLAILNLELAKTGCQAKVIRSALCVVPTAGDGAVQTSGTSVSPIPQPAPPASPVPATPQLPQYPGAPSGATAAPGSYGGGR